MLLTDVWIPPVSLMWLVSLRDSFSIPRAVIIALAPGPGIFFSLSLPRFVSSSHTAIAPPLIILQNVSDSFPQLKVKNMRSRVYLSSRFCVECDETGGTSRGATVSERKVHWLSYYFHFRYVSSRGVGTPVGLASQSRSSVVLSFAATTGPVVFLTSSHTPGPGKRNSQHSKQRG